MHGHAPSQLCPAFCEEIVLDFQCGHCPWLQICKGGLSGFPLKKNNKKARLLSVILLNNYRITEAIDVGVRALTRTCKSLSSTVVSCPFASSCRYDPNGIASCRRFSSCHPSSGCLDSWHFVPSHYFRPLPSRDTGVAIWGKNLLWHLFTQSNVFVQLKAVKLSHIFGVREYVNVRTRKVTLKRSPLVCIPPWK